ncbi:aldose 1-epimerase family protein [Sinomonas sp. ASV322]|uniref:aldose 1-epimerase family protein n=1 Tax=Sinomonas sp. ASV322 TaxID=3041920 RepID=UPI0027DB950E|nr:aldose 1-epimerase family protein [Sinomonas sp. ASV322]MDQ4502899.1 aldose 1-epimerase family protein [Sinomonas sp. ASV322]
MSVTIRAGAYTAVVAHRGGALASLQYEGRDLVLPFDPGSPVPDYRGIVAAPWPNRLANGRYTAGGQKLAVPVNEPERGCALHGLVFGEDWRLTAHDGASATFALELAASEGYPFELRLEVQYRLRAGAPGDPGGLDWSVRAVNAGDGRAPYGVCPHPYLVAGPSPLDTWTLEVPAERFLEVTSDRLLPRRTRSVAGHEFDFTSPRPIGATAIDHAFTGIGFDDLGTARVAIRDPSGTGVAMSWDTGCPWVQIHTADREPPGPTREGLAVEPMTCPPNAFASGTDLVWLEPGRTHAARWTIAALGA